MNSYLSDEIIGVCIGFCVVWVVVGGGVLLLWGIAEPFEWRVTGEGEHTGYVTAIGIEGWFWRTWAVWFKSDTQSTQEDTYCLRDHELIPTLQAASRDHRRITITWETYLTVDWAECSAMGRDAITAVREANA